MVVAKPSSRISCREFRWLLDCLSLKQKQAHKQSKSEQLFRKIFAFTLDYLDNRIIAVFCIIISMNTIDNSAEIIEQLNDRILAQEQQLAELNAKLKWCEEQFRLSRRLALPAKTSDEQISCLNRKIRQPQTRGTDSETITYQRKKKQVVKEKTKEPVEVIEYGWKQMRNLPAARCTAW